MKAEHIILLSGGDRAKGFLFPELEVELCRILAGKQKLVAIAATGNPVSADKSFLGADDIISVADQFAFSGLSDFQLLDSRVTTAEGVQMLAQADVIYLMGGDPLWQIDFLKKSGYDKQLQAFTGVFIGLSAGSMNLAKQAFYSADEDGPESFFYDGLGACDVTIDPHFDFADENRLKMAQENAAKHAIIGLADNSAVLVSRDEKLKFLGNCQIFGK